ncbi:MAG: hypothetical protein J6B72_05665 [Clostridia bacterium]|nr:hypothetical protein [Clostridia bacterium]
MRAKTTKAIRVLTLAPIMALITLCALYIKSKDLFGGAHMLALAVFFLFLLPILAYPCQPIVPYFKGKGREGQRNLAMVFAVVGYVAGCITNLFLHAPLSLWIIYLDYLISGALVVIINKVFRLRASAHACGIIGPAALLVYFGIPWAVIPALALYALALWASLDMKRHTWQQFVGGAVIPLIVLAALHLILGN